MDIMQMDLRFYDLGFVDDRDFVFRKPITKRKLYAK